MKAAREAKGLTQESLGRLIGRRGNSIARVEKGTQGIEWEAFEKVVEILGQEATYYLDPTEKPIKSAKLELLERIAAVDEDEAKVFLDLLGPSLPRISNSAPAKKKFRKSGDLKNND